MTPDHPPRPTWLPHAAFAGCCLIWGSTFLVIRIGDDQLPPFWAASLRHVLALLLLAPLLAVLRVPLPRGHALRSAGGFGLLNFGFSFCLLYWGETRVPSGLTAVIYATIPLTTSLFARAFRLERLSVRRLGAALVALSGVGIIFWEQVRGSFDPLHVLGILLAAPCAALSGVILKRGPRQHPLGANAAGMAVGLAVCLLASLMAREPHPLPHPGAALGSVIYLAVAGSIGAFGLYAWLVQRWPVSRVAFIAVVIPVVALLLGSWARQERLTAVQSLGSALVMGGLALAVLGDALRGAAER